ncbi:tyrosine-type recombinase/integrase [Arthrobacter glacialis]|uniref:tyrosine-type recombinase/integrase n=1 Tax=Arthrobacter glacialis TaxID=1664 RepID=UPI0013FD3972|nr:tyrosine-type recombinase/integrase [Arthrobacter glacialis]
MASEGRSSRTVSERMYFFQKLARETSALTVVTRQQLIHWTGAQEWSHSTRAHNRSALYVFFTWMQDEDIRLDNPAARLPKVKTRKREPNPFSVEEIQTLLNSGIYSKTRAMVALHYYLGLRVSEISRVHGNDVNWDRKMLTTVGKGTKLARLPVPEAAWPLFLAMPRTGYWFPNRAANRLWPAGEGHILGNSVSDLLAQAIRRAGLDHRPHDLRAATATEMHSAGVSAFTIQKAMRHSNMDTTTRYLGLTVEQVRDGISTLPSVTMPQRSGRKRAA